MTVSNRCTAKASLTADEVQYLNALPDPEHEVSTEPVPCEFSAHGPEALHTCGVQQQYLDGFDGPGIFSWLVWGDDGHHEVLVADDCRKDTGEESCLLIAEHPGSCDTGLPDPLGTWILEGSDDGYGFAWSLDQEFYLSSVNEDIPADAVADAQKWAAEELREHDVTVARWVQDPAKPLRWVAERSADAPDGA